MNGKVNALDQDYIVSVSKKHKESFKSSERMSGR